MADEQLFGITMDNIYNLPVMLVCLQTGLNLSSQLDHSKNDDPFDVFTDKHRPFTSLEHPGPVSPSIAS